MKVRRCAQCGFDLRDFDDRIECPDCGFLIAESRRARERAWGRVGRLLALVVGPIVVTVPLVMHMARERWWPEPEAVDRDRVRVDCDTLIRKVRGWMRDSGRTTLPADFVLDDLVHDSGMYATSTELYDPWGNRFVLDVSTLRVTSYGSDGLPGGIGDAKDIISQPLP